MAQLFVSYRRDDEAAWARSLVAELERVYGADAVFMDVDDIDAGDRFPHVIGDRIAASDAVVVVIGPRWAGSADERGGRRLDHADDWVRLEIETALQRQIPVFPVLVADTVMPKASELPQSLAVLCDLNAVHVSAGRFKADVERLLAGLAKICPPGPARTAGIHPRRGDAPSGRSATSSCAGRTFGAFVVAVIAVGAALVAVNLLRDDDPPGAFEVNSGEDESVDSRGPNTLATAPLPEGVPLGSCTIEVDHIGARILTEPQFDARLIISVPDGAYRALEARETAFAGRTFLWFLIEVDGRQGWIVDDGIVIDAKSAGCP